MTALEVQVNNKGGMRTAEMNSGNLSGERKTVKLEKGENDGWHKVRDTQKI